MSRETEMLWGAVAVLALLVALHLSRHLWAWLNRPPKPVIYPEFCRRCGSTMRWRQWRSGFDFDARTGMRLPPNRETLECSGDKTEGGYCLWGTDYTRTLP